MFDGLLVDFDDDAPRSSDDLDGLQKLSLEEEADDLADPIPSDCRRPMIRFSWKPTKTYWPVSKKARLGPTTRFACT